MILKVKKLHENAQMPFYATKGSAGMDLVAVSAQWDRNENTIKYGTGLAFEIPEGFVGLLFPRSSVCKKTLTLTNCVGVIDSDYRGEVSAVFRITNPQDEKVYAVGERCCQLVVVPAPQFELLESELSDTERGAGGYGSTGK